MTTDGLTQTDIRLIARNWANQGLFDTLAKKYSGILEDPTVVSRDIALILAERGVFDDCILEIFRQSRKDHPHSGISV